MTKTKILLYACMAVSWALTAQNVMTPELLLQVGRVNAQGISKDGQYVIYTVSTPSLTENRSLSKTYRIPVKGGEATEITNAADYFPNPLHSPNGQYTLLSQEVQIHPVSAQDYHPDILKSSARIYDALNYRHWDEWEDGRYNHVFVAPLIDGEPGEAKDLMPGEPYDCPQKPFGGEEDFCWSPDGSKVLYVTKKAFGTQYATSTNTDIYAYDMASGTTTNLTQGMMGYDVNPVYSSTGVLAWLSMKRDGYESDKNDIVVMAPSGPMNLTAQWDGTVNSFLWSKDGSRLYFNAAVAGTVQLFEVDYPGLTKKMPVVRQITQGEFDVNSLVGQVANTLIITRTDMNHAAELYTVDLSNGSMTQLSHVNDKLYAGIPQCRVEKRMVPTTDGKQMLVWVIYPPNFNPSQKYPTLLYCQGGPQSALSQFYSYRWNFQLMASQGYIVVAPNRRGMPGHGVAWNEQISKDHGGQVMSDYLSAIDAVAKEPFVDNSRLGCIGASYGGYSVFYLAGIHNNRFKTFISHDGIFNLKSMYGTTEELFFVNWDLGGPYWDVANPAAVKSYTQFDPSNLVSKWNKPILIIQGGKDYRVPDGQAFEAFQAAQLQGLKSRLIYLPDENHWVLKVNNALLWHREFYRWLQETL